jgi:DNA polymerase-3 subunit gamma/tau
MPGPVPAGGQAVPKSRTLRIPTLHELKNGEASSVSEPRQKASATSLLREQFTLEDLKLGWAAFAEQRRHLQAEYLVLQNDFVLEDTTIVLQLLNPVQETLLNGLKSELTAFLRERLRNGAILIKGQIVQTQGKKTIYTAREKFDHLAEKNPALRELKDRLGLDTDF